MSNSVSSVSLVSSANSQNSTKPLTFNLPESRPVLKLASVNNEKAVRSGPQESTLRVNSGRQESTLRVNSGRQESLAPINISSSLKPITITEGNSKEEISSEISTGREKMIVETPLNIAEKLETSHDKSDSSTEETFKPSISIMKRPDTFNHSTSSEKVEVEEELSRTVPTVKKLSRTVPTVGEATSPVSFSKKPSREYPVYIIYSQWQISSLLDEIKKNLPEENESSEESELIGPIRLVYSRGEETDRAICVFDPKIYEIMESKGLTKKKLWTDFRVSRFKLFDTNLPKHRNQRHLFVALPESLTIDEIKQQIEALLQWLVVFSIIRPDTYQIAIPFASRESNKHVGECYIIWDKSVPIEDIAMVRVILHQSNWYDIHGRTLEKNKLRLCSWSRVTDPRNIKMSPADRSYNHNPSKNRQNKIKRSKQSSQGKTTERNEKHHPDKSLRQGNKNSSKINRGESNVNRRNKTKQKYGNRKSKNHSIKKTTDSGKHGSIEGTSTENPHLVYQVKITETKGQAPVPDIVYQPLSAADNINIPSQPVPITTGQIPKFEPKIISSPNFKIPTENRALNFPGKSADSTNSSISQMVIPGNHNIQPQSQQLSGESPLITSELPTN